MNRQAFFAALRGPRGLFPAGLSQAQVDGVETILSAASGLPSQHVAYVLATAHHETGGQMVAVKETTMAWHRDRVPDDDEVIRRLDKAWSTGKLPWVRTPYWRRDKQGEAWFGRGLVQLTHRENYDQMGEIVGVDLLADPSRALHPETAARILVEGMVRGVFRGARLDDFALGDYETMRGIVNGPDGKAAEVARLAAAYEAALTAGGYDAAPPAPPARETPPPGLWAAIVALLRRILGG